MNLKVIFQFVKFAYNDCIEISGKVVEDYDLNNSFTYACIEHV